MGSFQGALKGVKATELGAAAIEAAVEQSGGDALAEAVDEVYMGNVIGAGLGQAPARQAALKAGLPESVPCTTVNKVCGSGMKAVIEADNALRLSKLNGGPLRWWWPVVWRACLMPPTSSQKCVTV